MRRGTKIRKTDLEALRELCDRAVEGAQFCCDKHMREAIMDGSPISYGWVTIGPQTRVRVWVFGRVSKEGVEVALERMDASTAFAFDLEDTQEARDEYGSLH